jgi:hypothetical protein
LENASETPFALTGAITAESCFQNLAFRFEMAGMPAIPLRSTVAAVRIAWVLLASWQARVDVFGCAAEKVVKHGSAHFVFPHSPMFIVGRIDLGLLRAGSAGWT